MSPIYEYECTKCKNRVEMIEKFSKPSEVCPVCGSVAKRIISVANHTFGWRFTQRSHEVGAEDELERNV